MLASPLASPLPLGLPLGLPSVLRPSESRPARSSAVGADRHGDGIRDRQRRPRPLGARSGGVNGGVIGSDDGSGSGNGIGDGNGIASGTGNGTGDGSGNGTGDVIGDGGGNGDNNDNGNGNGNGSGDSSKNSNGGGILEGAAVGDSSVSHASRAELLVRMGLVRARLGGGKAAGDRGLRPVAESLWRDVEELGKSEAGAGGANQSAGE